MNHNYPGIDTGRRHYYSSSRGPFHNVNNILMFYGGGHRGWIVETIISALRDKEVTDRVFHIHGESGSGKTMLSLVLCDRLRRSMHTIRYEHPVITPSRLLRHLLIELCPQNADLISAEQARLGADKASIDSALNCIRKQIVANMSLAHSRPYVLLIDSPCRLSAEVARLIDVLGELKADEQSALFCCIFHTTDESAVRLSRMASSAHQQNNHFWLRRLTLSEIEEYLCHHMMLFDYNRRNMFTRQMAYFIAERTEGVLRSINSLARDAFTIANLEDTDRLSMSHLLMAGLPVREDSTSRSEFKAKRPRSRIALVGLGVVALLAGALVLIY
ncbi:MAG: hypothetical protein AB8B63_20105 [Granulosicoccus sp.]